MSDNYKNVVLIYELVKKENKYTYEFHSLALANFNGKDEFTIATGILKNGTYKDFDMIDAYDELLIRGKISDSVIINNPLGKFGACQYAIYAVPELVYEEIGKKPSSQILVSLCSLASIMKFRWTENNSEYVAIKDKDNIKKQIEYWNDNILDIYEMLDAKDIKNDKKEISKEKELEVKLEKENSIRNIDINKLISDIKKKIVGQDTTVESIVANIYANQLIIESGDRDFISSQKANILLEGPTGTGKTAILNEVADKLSLPIYGTSVTEYSSVGYIGSSLTDILVKLLEKTNGNLELAEHGIVYLDEFDKLAQDPKKPDSLAIKTAVQQEFLAFIGGAKFNVKYNGIPYEFDTTNITFVAMGAFTDIRNKKIEELKKEKTTIGFNTSNTKSDKQYKITEQDYVDSGLQRELVGRFALNVSTKAYMPEDYKNILLNSSISSLVMFTKFANNFGIDVTYDQNFIDTISQIAYEKNFGVRGLQKIFAKIKNIFLLDIINRKTTEISLSVNLLNIIKEDEIKKF